MTLKESLLNSITIDEVIDVLKEIIRFKSVSWEEKSLAEYLKSYFDATGMTTSIDRHGNFYAEYRNGNPVVMLNTHMDVVPVGSDWKTDPFEPVEDGRDLIGRGACDAKGSLAAFIIAVKKVLANGNRPKGTILLMAATTEEPSPPEVKGTWKAIMDGRIKADMAICGEPTGNTACIAELGRMEYELISKGRSSHANTPEQGINAIVNMAALVTALNKKVARPYCDLMKRRGTFLIGTIKGGVQSNVVPEECRALLDRGLIPGQTHEDSIGEIRAICDEVAAQIPDLSYDIKVNYTGNPAAIPADSPVAQAILRSIETVTGKPSKPAGFPAHCDADWIITLGKIPTVIFGPGSLKYAHSCCERVNMDEVYEAAKIVTLALDDLVE